MTAKEYSAFSGQLRQVAATIKPPDGHPLKHALEVAAFHANQAAKKLQEAAEWAAERERKEASDAAAR